MAEENKKKSVEQLQEEQLNEINGGENLHIYKDGELMDNLPMYGLHNP